MSIKEIIDKGIQFIFGREKQLEKREIDIRRHKFSSMLPYKAYDPDTKAYFLKNNSIGFIFECSPLILAGDKSFEQIRGLFRLNLPEETVVQISMYADNYINDILYYYLYLREKIKGNKPVLIEQARKYVEFLKKGSREGLWQISHTPIRNFRLFVSFSIPAKTNPSEDPEGFINESLRYSKQMNTALTILKTMGVHPQWMEPNEIVATLFRFFNPELDPDFPPEYRDEIPINKQIIFADTEIKKDLNSVKIGNLYGACITPKLLPLELDNSLFNQAIGFFAKSPSSIADDEKQIKGKFILTTTYTYKNLDAIIEKKIGTVKLKKNSSQRVQVRKEEAEYIQREIAEGEKYMEAIPVLWIFTNSKEDLEDAVDNIRAIWKEIGIEAQRELYPLLHVLLVGALPLGMYKEVIPELDRQFYLPSKGAALLAPIQGGYKGVGEPYVLFVDRRGQISTFDIFKTGKNKNFFICGGSGGGKSFFGNTLVSSYLSTGAKVRIIDIGRSYEKACRIFDGQYIEFSKENIVINFFDQIKTLRPIRKTPVIAYDENGNEFVAREIDTNDIVEFKDDLNDYYLVRTEVDTERGIPSYIGLVRKQDMKWALAPESSTMLTSIVSTMAFSLTKEEKPTALQLNILKNAIEEIYKRKAYKMEVQDIIDYLKEGKSFTDEVDENTKRKAKTEAYNLAQMLKPFSREGAFGKYFNGKSNVTFNSDLVVVELDGTPEDLRKVVVLAFTTLIENEVYTGDRVTPTIILLDEAWQTLSHNPSAAEFVNGMYRKARKYNASIGIITQSITDIGEGGPIEYLGSVVRSNSEFFFSLYDENSRDGFKKGLYPGLREEWEYKMFIETIPVKSVPRYSELFIKSPAGISVVRLIVDPYTYFVNTSDPEDITVLNYEVGVLMQKENLSKDIAYAKAIEKLAKMVEEGKYSKYKEEILVMYKHKTQGDNNNV